MAAVAVVAVVALSGGGDDGSDGAAPDESFAFDGGAVTVTPISVDSPGGVSLGEEGLWVSNYERAAISLVDTESGRVGERIPVGEGPLSLVATDGAVWVINGDGSTVSKVEIERGQVVGNPIEISSYATGDSIAAGEGRVWVVLPDPGEILPIEASSGTPGDPISPPDGTAGELAFGEGGFWVVGDAGTVTLLDPATGEAEGEPIRVGKKLPEGGDVFRGEIAVGEGAVWVAGLDDETVARVDPRSRKVVKTIRVEDGIEGDLAVGGGAVWVVSESGGLIRIDPAKNAISGSPLPTGTAGAYDMTVGAGAAWIAGATDTDTVTKVVP